MYHPFPDTLAQWSENSLSCQGDPPFTTCYVNGYLLSLSADTLIDGKAYVLVGFNHTWTETYTGPITTATNLPFQVPDISIGALRTDSSKRVWFRKLNATIDFANQWNWFPLDSDILLYDFNAQAGDSLGWKVYSAKVIQVDSFQLTNGEWRRKIIFDDGEYWIEGVGSLFGLFGSYQPPPFEGAYFLNCFRQNDELLLESLPVMGTDCDHIYTGINDLVGGPGPAVFPNPAADFVTFDLSTPGLKSTITIYNSEGEQVQRYSNFHSPQLKINVSDIGADGLYFYMISVNAEKSETGAFLIQR